MYLVGLQIIACALQGGSPACCPKREPTFRSRTAQVACLALAGAVTMTVAPVGHAHAQRRLDVSYSITVARISVGDLTGTVEIGPDDYTVSANGRVSGAARVLTSGEGSSIAHGIVMDGRLIPTNFASKSTFPGDPPEVKMEFEKGDVRKFDAAAPGRDRVPLTEANLQSVVDPLTAMLVTFDNAADSLSQEVCRRTMAVFDGHQRYDLVLEPKGMENVKAERGYSGMAMICSAKHKPIAGHRASAPLLKFLSGREIEVALAPVAGTRVLVPFRLSVESWIANLVVKATRFEATLKPLPH